MPISLAEPHLTLKITVQTKLIRNIVIAVTEQVNKTTSLLECQVRNVWACSSVGPTSGNQGRSNSRFANLDSASLRLLGSRLEESSTGVKQGDGVRFGIELP